MSTATVTGGHLRNMVAVIAGALLAFATAWLATKIAYMIAGPDRGKQTATRALHAPA